MTHLRYFIVFLTLCFTFTHAYAAGDETGKLIFSRDKLTIVATGSIPIEVPLTDAPTQDNATAAQPELKVGDKDPKTGQTIVFKKDTPEDKKAAPPKATKTVMSTEPRELTFSTEVRDPSAFTLEWLPSLHNLTDTSAYMVLLPNSPTIPIGQLRTPKKLDIVIIRPNGRILAIMPDIAPSSLGSDIDAGEDVRGVLFLKAGIAKAQGIKPNDEVRHSGFTNDPKVLK